MEKQETNSDLKKSSPDTIRVNRDHVVEVMKAVEKVHKEEMLAFGYAETGKTVRVNDLTFFESVDDAKQFAAHKANNGIEYRVLPVEAFEIKMRDLLFLNPDLVNNSQVLELGFKEIEHLQYELNFTRSANMLEFDMSNRNWKEMDPAALSIYLNDLKSMYEDSDRGKIQVIDMLNHYWPDILKEKKELLFLNQLNNYTMNEKNFDYLKDNIKYMGFGEKQHEALEANLKEGKDSFQLTFTADINKKPFEAVLQFRKSDTSDMYFLNSYHATLERSNGEKKDQTFYLNKGKGVTAKEAYNLLEGRPVFKELTNKQNEPYKAWIQLDFENKDKHQNHEVKQFHENYGYDLKAAVGKFAVKDLDGGDNEKKLMHSLEKGNIQSVTIEKAGAEVKMFIEANPQYKTVTLYDEGFRRVQKEDLAQYQSTKQLNGKEVKQSAGQEQKEVKEDQKQGKQVGKKNKDEKDNSLLPKKRNRQKKGLGLK